MQVKYQRNSVKIFLQKKNKKIFVCLRKLFIFVENKIMEHVLNLQAISRRMKNKPKTSNLYLFFYGRSQSLDPEQIKEMKKVAEKEHKILMEFLDESLVECKNRS
jgi:hypothetical protein